MNNLLKLNSISETGKKVKINGDEIYLDSIAYFTISEGFFIKTKVAIKLKNGKILEYKGIDKEYIISILRK